MSDLESADTSSNEKPQQALPFWKLAMSAIPWIGVQALWSTEFAVTTPYMKDLGMSDAWSSNIWIFGPITGFFTAPVIGSISDGCQSRFGRRRPFIAAGLVLLWAASLLFASSRYIFPGEGAKWFALAMFFVLDVVINIIQTPIRSIVADMASQDQQVDGQIISVLFQGIGNLLGFGIMKIWAVPFKAIIPLMILVLSILSVFVFIQMSICHETPYVPKEDTLQPSIARTFAGAFGAVFYMPRDLVKLAVVQFFSWYSMFCYWPTLSTWFSVNVFMGSADAPEGSDLRLHYEEGQNANSTAGLLNSGLMIVFSMMLVAMMLQSNLPIRFIYAGCLYAGAIALIMAKLAVGHSVIAATLVATVIAIPVSAISAFPFALVGAMNKSAEEEGKEADTGKQMGVLNIFICAPQLFATFAVTAMRERLSDSALPWVFLMAGGSFAVAGTAALALNDRLVRKALT